MDILLSVQVDPFGLAGFPREYNPRIIVWTTDPRQRQTIIAGTAVDTVDLVPIPASTRLETERPIVFNAASDGDFPVLDPRADVCVALYAHSRMKDGSGKPVSESRERDPYSISLGQFAVPWHVLLRFLVKDGHSLLARNEQPEDETIFPSTTLTQDLVSLNTVDGIRYRLNEMKEKEKKHAESEWSSDDDDDDESPKQSLTKLLSENLVPLSTKARVIIHVSCVDRKRSALDTRLERIEHAIVQSAPSHGTSFDALVRSHDKESGREERLIVEATTRYMETYKTFFDASTSRLNFPNVASKGASLTFEPDVPSLSRFHLTTWINGSDRYPFAEWWLATLPNTPLGRASLPEPTEATELFLVNLSRMALRRVSLSERAFVDAVRQYYSGA